MEDNAGNDETDGGKLMIYAQQSSRLQKFRHYYQYPYFRLFVAYFVTFCNFLIYAEDPVAHSYSKCEIPIIGNAFSFVVTKWPPNAFSLLKVLLCLTAIVIGILVGKLVIHHLLLKRCFKLSMFSNDQGSWMICFLFTMICLVILSFVYNGFLSLNDDMEPYKITGYIGAKNHVFMRAAAIGTWFGDFLTSWMVTDMMLQDNQKYVKWATKIRVWWKEGLRRVYLFWVFFIVLTVMVIVIVSTDILNWDTFNRDVFYTNEVGRSFLASFILVMDFTIVMQDWDFPLFQSNLDVKLPGVNTAHIKFDIPKCLKRENWVIHITGKWFNYGILFIVMLLDLNMWKNQIFYNPLDFGQYTGPEDKIYSVMDDWSLDRYKNETVYSYEWRLNNIDPITNQTYITADFRTNSRFRGKPLSIRGLAFIPSILVLLMFGVLIYIFGREGTSQFESPKKKRQQNLSERVTGVRISQIDPDHTDGTVIELDPNNDEKQTSIQDEQKNETDNVADSGHANYGSTASSPPVQRDNPVV
ncbi:transmembrane protein 117-like [Clytia hemisphaerica]|uniref:Transmembrane protein n=1 Tax=Clytia hemisphaerica TaxID=252671 RepID=A0A7M5X2S6_9CNID|eukprot:TCONS_00020430-protein